MPRHRRNYRRVVESVVPLIAQLAWRTYSRLPAYTRGFLDVDDLVQYGVLAVKRYEHSWNPQRAGYTTFVQYVVSTELENYIASLRTGKRWHEPVSLDAPIVPDDEAHTVVLKLGTTELAYDEFATFDSYYRVYQEASPKARKLLGLFIGNPLGEAKPLRGIPVVVTSEVPKPSERGPVFRPASYPKELHELRRLCRKYQMSYDGLLRISRGALNA